MVVSDRHAWAEPGLEEVTDGVYRVPLPLPNDALRAVNVYLLADDDGFTAVDSGWAIDTAREQLRTALRQLGADFGSLRRFLITHVHRDHYHQATVLRRELGTPIALGTGERPTLDVLERAPHPLAAQVNRLDTAGADDLAGRLRAEIGDHRVDPEEWPMPDSWLADGQQVTVGERAFDVVATPGHTRGHVILRDPRGLCLAGDHVLPHITPSIGFEAAPVSLPLGDFLASLRRMRTLPDTWLLPAHGPVRESVHERVDELLAHHDERLATVHETVRAGAATPAACAAKLTWTRRARALGDLDLFNAMLAVLETQAHLDLLVARGELTADQTDGVWHYRQR